MRGLSDEVFGPAQRYRCSNCGSDRYGRPKRIRVGLRRLKIGPCCWKPGRPLPIVRAR